MTHGAHQDAPRPPASDSDPAAEALGAAASSVDVGSPEAGELAQAIVTRLFTAGLDLDSALARMRDGPGTAQIRHAVAEIDVALRDLRRLALITLTPAPEPARSSRAEASGEG
jgi:hypothetical protein